MSSEREPDQVLIGASGAHYSYFKQQDRMLSIGMPGNYMFLKSAAEPEVIMVGATDDLSRMPAMIHGATFLNYEGATYYVRFNLSAEDREREVEDLIRAYDPPANRQRG